MRRSVIVVGVCCILAAAFVVAAPPQAAQAEASFAPTSLALRTPVNGWANARLVIAGPEGFRVERAFLAGEPLAVDLSRLKDAKGERLTYPDGRYKWELTLTAPLAGAKLQFAGSETTSEAWVSSGAFFVENGSLVAPPPPSRGEDGLSATVAPTASVSEQSSSPIGPVTAQTTNPYGNHFSGIATVAGNFAAGDTTIADGYDGGYDMEVYDPSGAALRWNDPGSTDADTSQWVLMTNSASANFSLYDYEHATRPVIVEESTPGNALYLDSTGRIGMGTSTPQYDLHIKDPGSSSVIEVEASTGEYGLFYTGNAYQGLGLYSPTYGYSEPLRIYHGAATGAITVNGPDVILGGQFTNYAPVTIGTLTATTNGLVAPMIVTTYTTGTAANGFGAMTQWGLEAADGTLAVAADFGGLWENATTKDGYLIFRAAHNGGATEYLRIEGSSGYIGLQVANPAYPIHHVSGARLTTGGVWTDASSRAFKQDIETLDAEAAIATVKNLTPVTYAYKADPSEHHVGFIAEDVPAMVAAKDRTGLAPMDVVAVLTKVVQEQQKTIEAQEAQIAELRGMVEKLAANR